MRITGYEFSLTREPLARPFSFKGGSFTEKWITVTALSGDDGTRVSGIGGLAVLWSDSRVFAEHSEVGGNLLMSAVAERAAQCAVGAALPGAGTPEAELSGGERSGSRGARPADTGQPPTPIDVQKAILPEVMEYARRVTGRDDLRKTFVLNSLVSLDLALWKLYAAAIGVRTFDEMIPLRYRDALPARHDEVAHVPLITYGIGVDDVAAMADAGTFVFKIKLGQAGNQREMLEKDKERLTRIHEAVGHKSAAAEGPNVPYGTGLESAQAHGAEADGKPGAGARGRPDRVLYYLDANGRYESATTLRALIDHLDTIGALPHVVLLEEPFPAELRADVSDLPVRVAGDESVEGPDDVRRLAEQGYGAFAIKPAGKTLSASLLAAEAARERGLQCFVADSACVPLLVEWNKNVAARLPALPGVGQGLLESNGADHYRRWKEMLADHPCAGAGWIEPRDGLYILDGDFYARSGCILGASGRYEELLPG